MRPCLFRRSSCVSWLTVVVGMAIASGVRAEDDARRIETGSLEAGDVRLSSGEYIDEFSLAGKAGEFVIIELHSADFNAFLQMSPSEQPGAEAELRAPVGDRQPGRGPPDQHPAGGQRQPGVEVQDDV